MNTEVKLTVTRGQDAQVSLQLLDENDQPEDLSDWVSTNLLVAETAESTDFVANETMSLNMGSFVGTLSLDADLTPGVYVCRALVTFESGAYPTETFYIRVN